MGHFFRKSHSCIPIRSEPNPNKLWRQDIAAAHAARYISLVSVSHSLVWYVTSSFRLLFPIVTRYCIYIYTARNAAQQHDKATNSTQIMSIQQTK